MLDTVTLGLAVFSGIILVGFSAEILFVRTNVPDVLVLFLLGIILGPLLGYVHPGDISNLAPFFTTFALVFILFEGALNINIHEFIRAAGSSFALSILNFFISIAAVFLIAFPLGFGIMGSIILGVILGGTSSAVVVPLMKRVTGAPNTKIVLSLESAITDVLCIVGTVLLLEVLRLQSVNILSTFGSLVLFFGVSFLIGAAAGVGFIFFNSWLQQFNKSYMTTIAILLLLYVLVTLMGGNGAIAALAFGLILGNSKHLPLFSDFVKQPETLLLNRPEKFFYSQVTFFVKVFFFVYLGVLISFSSLFPFLLGLLISILILMTRPLAVWFLFAKTQTQRDRALLESIFPRGLAAAVLVQLVLASPEGALLPRAAMLPVLVLSVILFTIIISSVLIFLVEKLNYPGTSIMAKRIVSAFRKKPSD